MKYLKSFNEAKKRSKKSIKRSKKSINTVDDIVSFINSIDMSYVKIQSDEDFDEVEIGKLLKKYNCVIIVPYLINEEFQVDIRFDRLRLYEKFTKIFDKTYPDIILGDNTDDAFFDWDMDGSDIPSVYIDLPAVDRKIDDYISKYKEDIEDLLISFEDIGYEILYCVGEMNGDSENDFQMRYDSDGEMDQMMRPMFVDESINGSSYMIDFLVDESKVKNNKISITAGEIRNMLVSVIRRLQLMKLKVILSSETSSSGVSRLHIPNKEFSITVVCEEDMFYNKIKTINSIK